MGPWTGDSEEGEETCNPTSLPVPTSLSPPGPADAHPHSEDHPGEKGGHGWPLGGTVSQACERLQHAPLEGSHRVLHTGPEAQHALELGLPYQQVPVGGQLVGPAEQGRDAVHELGHQARVGVVGLAVVVGHDLRGSRAVSIAPVLSARLPPRSPTGCSAPIL